MKLVTATSLLLPLYVLEHGDTIKDVPSGSYVLGRKGVCLVSEGAAIKSAKNISCDTLPDINNEVEYSGPKVDAASLATSELIFQQVWNEYKTESEVILYRRNTDGKWYIRLPKQVVSSISVKYDLDDTDPWFSGGKKVAPPKESDVTLFGTIHSHGSLSAFFSGTDNRDHQEVTGVHIVYGLFIEEVLPSYPARVTVSPITPDRVMARVCGDSVFGNLPLEDLAVLKEVVVTMPLIPEGHITTYAKVNYAYPGCGIDMGEDMHSPYGIGGISNRRSSGPHNYIPGSEDECPLSIIEDIEYNMQDLEFNIKELSSDLMKGTPSVKTPSMLLAIHKWKQFTTAWDAATNEIDPIPESELEGETNPEFKSRVYPEDLDYYSEDETRGFYGETSTINWDTMVPPHKDTVLDGPVPTPKENGVNRKKSRIKEEKGVDI